ncbi:MAG: SGNH/GDSL hydrolase family protein [Sedimentisphaerales bacterium]|nr:SGNH/GDSL hydrolase family protein [Sedimentisphaerales bacterium]
MRSRPVVLGVLLAWLLLTGVVSAQGSFYLKDGDRVVFYGDSITEQRLYTTYVETYVVTRLPELEVSFVHSGVGGDRVTGGWAGPIDLRLARDVFAYKPTVLTIMLGMNDGSYRAFDDGIFNTYSSGYQHMLDSIQSTLPGIRITLIQPSPYDDVTRPPNFEGGYNAVLVRYGRYVEELARRQKCDVADLNASVVAALEKAKAADAETAKKIIGDRVHPGPSGHLLMAEALLKAWNAPAIVTAVEIDVTKGQTLRVENATVSDLKASNGLTWTQSDKALPMPLDLKDPAMKLVVRSSDFLQALNWQPLKVTGLNGRKYVLKIDGDPIGAFTAGQLAEGVNLAEFPTPMVRQAQTVHDLTIKHNNIHAARWRELQVFLAQLSLPHVPQAIEALDAVEADMVAQQRLAAQPRSHSYELLPAD